MLWHGLIVIHDSDRVLCGATASLDTSIATSRLGTIEKAALRNLKAATDTEAIGAVLHQFDRLGCLVCPFAIAQAPVGRHAVQYHFSMSVYLVAS